MHECGSAHPVPMHILRRLSFKSNEYIWLISFTFLFNIPGSLSSAWNRMNLQACFIFVVFLYYCNKRPEDFPPKTMCCVYNNIHIFTHSWIWLFTDCDGCDKYEMCLPVNILVRYICISNGYLLTHQICVFKQIFLMSCSGKYRRAIMLLAKTTQASYSA